MEPLASSYTTLLVKSGGAYRDFMLLTFFFLENLLIGGDEFGHYLSKISGNFIRKILASIFVC